MKATALTAFVLLASYAYAGKIKYAEKHLDQIYTFRNECFDEEDVDSKYLHQVDDSETIPSFEELKCHTLCMINKFQLLDNELRFLPEVYKLLFDDSELWEKVERNILKCLPSDMKLRTCEDAYDLQVCVHCNI